MKEGGNGGMNEWITKSVNKRTTKWTTKSDRFFNSFLVSQSFIASAFYLYLILFHYSVHWIVWLIGSSLPSLLLSLIYFIVYLLAFCAIYLFICNVSSAWRDQMSSSDSVVTATENASRLGYKHLCVNYLHVASHDYQEVIQHTHTSTLSLTHRIVLFFSRSTPTSLSTRIQLENESSKYYWIKNISHKHVIRQTKEGVRRHKGSTSQYS